MPRSPRPHVLLVVFDAARRDAFAPYDRSARTPAVAALARRGVAVPHAFSTAPRTLPSHLAMFTGAIATEFGLDQVPGGDQRGVHARIETPAEQTLAGQLTAAGYASHGYSANLEVSAHSGFDTGFDTFQYRPPSRLEQASGARPGGRRARLVRAREGLSSAGDGGAAVIGAELRSAINAADTDTPQFWFVNLVEARSPYLPPRPWNDLGRRARIRAALDAQRYLSFEAIRLAAAGGLAPPPDALARLSHLHRQAVAYLDAWLAGLLATLARRGMLDDTLVIVCSDHGECFGEDGLLAHGFSLVQALIHVPLVVAGPGAERFRRASGALSLRELPGLVGAAAGLGDDCFGAPGDGVAIAHAAAICPPDDPRMRAFAERWSLSTAQVARLTAECWAATDGEQTVSLINGTLASRPGTPSSGARLLTALEQARGTGVARWSELHAARPLAPSSAGSPDAVAARERQMKLLGYV